MLSPRFHTQLVPSHSSYPHQDVVSDGFAKLLDGDLEAAQLSLKPVEALHSDIMKLPRWLPNCEDIRMTISTVRAYSTLVVQADLKQALSCTNHMDAKRAGPKCVF